MWVKSIAELNGKVYIVVRSEDGSVPFPLMYDCNLNHWKTLPELPTGGLFFSVAALPSRKQLLAIGGIVRKDGIVEATNKYLFGMRNMRSGFFHTLICLLHDSMPHVLPMDYL